MAETTQRFETLALHGGGWRSEPDTGAVAVPIYQSTSFQFKDTEHADRLFALDELGFISSRVTNPTFDALEQRVAALEGGAAALAVASGQAASGYSVLNLAGAGDNIVSSTDLYGGTWALFAATLKHFGVETRFVDSSDPENFRRASDARTRAWYAESLPNPKLEVFPIGEVAALGRALGIPLVVDNTAAPLLIRPLEHGAAVVVHSATKYIGGHGTTIGGLIIDGGNFPWEQFPERCPTLHQPDPSYHGAIWLEKAKPLGPIAYLVRTRCVLLRDIGAASNPFAAFQLLQGIETLPLRIRQHSENAARVAEFLRIRPNVTRVIYPGFHIGLTGERARKYLRGGFGGLLGLELAGGREAGRTFINALKLFYHVANIGDARSLAIHPATTTHSQLTTAEQAATGVTPGYVRLSIGIEHADDIIADIAQALDAAEAGAVPVRQAA